MKTNFKELNFHDIAVISMIALGVCLLGAELFVSLPEKGQGNIVSALEVFNISETLPNDLEKAGIAVAAPQKIMDKLYISLAELIAVPQQDVLAVQKIIASYFTFAEQTAVAYQNLYTASDTGNEGRVLGASIGVSDEQLQTVSGSGEQLYIPYSYEGILFGKSINFFETKILTLNK